MNYNDKAIGFAPDLVPLIMSGKKTLTYRVGDKYGFLDVGDIILVKNSSNDKIFAKVKITEIDHITFDKLPIDREGHEVYLSKEKQRTTFQKYYGKNIEDFEPMLIIGFNVTEKVD